MRDIPANLNGHKLMVTESPMLKMRKSKGKDGEDVEELATDRDGVAQHVVGLFVKARPREGGGFVGKGEEIRVTLTADPGEGFGEGTYVELVDLVINSYSMETEDGRTISGISFKAAGLKPATTSGVRSVA